MSLTDTPKNNVRYPSILFMLKCAFMLHVCVECYVALSSGGASGIYHQCVLSVVNSASALSLVPASFVSEYCQ